ncbi:hypothetical protein CsatB_027723 [Cannabis sativa]
MTIDDWSRRNSLFHATLSGDYTTAKKIIEENPNILKKDFLESKGRKETVLHVAVGAKQAKYFVRQLLRDFEDYIDVSLKDSMGNTAFFSACAAGILDIVDEFLKLKNCRDFITIPGGGDVSPLYIAVSFGHGKVASRLYYQTKSFYQNYFSPRNDLHQRRNYGIFFQCICNDLYDLALILLEDDDITQGVEIARLEDNQTALHLLSRKPHTVFATPKFQGTLCSRLILGQSTVEESKALKLVKVVWNRILEAKNYIHSEISKEIQFPFHLLMEATKVGNHDFLVVILSGYPELIWERTHENETIFNFAVKNRHVDIFKLIHEVGLSKQLVQNFEDERSGNNLLHIAALKPPHSRLRSIVGSALQMREQILWFQEVRNIVIPSLRNKMNLSGQTPQDLFTEKHNDLMKDSEKWMKKNANICLLVATIIVTIIFQANSDISSSGDENTNRDISRDKKANSSNIESSIGNAVAPAKRNIQGTEGSDVAPLSVGDVPGSTEGTIGVAATTQKGQNRTVGTPLISNSTAGESPGLIKANKAQRLTPFSGPIHPMVDLGANPKDDNIIMSLMPNVGPTAAQMIDKALNGLYK